MIVALSRFTIANDKAEEVHQAFQRRPHLVDTTPGFLGMEVMHASDDTSEIWLFTRWSDQASYEAWHKSADYHESHKQIPKGLKLKPGATEIRVLEVFAE